ECPAATVLTAEPHRMPLQEKRAEGERLGQRPIDSLCLAYFQTPQFELAGDLWMRSEMFRHSCEGSGDGLKFFLRHTGCNRLIRVCGFHAGPLAGKAAHADTPRRAGLDLLERRLKLIAKFFVK